MFLFVLLGLFLLIAVLSVLGLTADSRDLRPRLPLQAPRRQVQPRWTEELTRTALPPYRRTAHRVP